MQGSKRVRTILSRIGDDYYKLGKPVGFGDLYRIRASLGKVGGSQLFKRICVLLKVEYNKQHHL